MLARCKPPIQANMKGEVQLQFSFCSPPKLVVFINTVNVKVREGSVKGSVKVKSRC